MSRIDLFVSPEQYPEVSALGACWDQQGKCWYIEPTVPLARFAAWLPDVQNGREGAHEFLIASREAYVASARVDCQQCRRTIDVICLYCRSGTVAEEPLEAFCVSCLWAVDDALRHQLERWPAFRVDTRQGIYLNHCSHCGASQDEADLHEEPDQPFHALVREVPEAITLVPLVGRVRMSGDYNVEL